jgi:hypothetical protein
LRERLTAWLSALQLVCTSVIIDALNNRRGRQAFLLELVRAGHVLACCPINITEVYAGMRPKEQAATEELVACNIFPSRRRPPVSLAS